MRTCAVSVLRAVAAARANISKPQTASSLDRYGSCVGNPLLGVQNGQYAAVVCCI